MPKVRKKSNPKMNPYSPKVKERQRRNGVANILSDSVVAAEIYNLQLSYQLDQLNFESKKIEKNEDQKPTEQTKSTLSP